MAARSKRTDPVKAGQVMAMADAGYTPTQIAKELGMSQTTCYYISNRQGIWADIDKKEWMKRYRMLSSNALETCAWDLAKKSFSHAEEKLPQASYAQAVMGGAILVDKARLFSGEPTEIHEVITRKNWDNMNDEMVMIHAEMGRRIAAAKVIEVEAEDAE